MAPVTERRLLQFCIILACFVPLLAGSAGVVQGMAMLSNTATGLDSHFRYLSGLLLGIGIAFLSAVPNIEHRGPRVRLLTLIVMTGGFSRLLGWVMIGKPALPMQAALVMELLVTPALCLWQGRVARRFP